MVLVESISGEGVPTHYLYWFGWKKILDFGLSGVFDLDVNALGIVSGSTFVVKFRAFRHAPWGNTTTLLDPLPTGPHSFGQAIDRFGGVLGYSFVAGALERIGVCDRTGIFTTYFELREITTGSWPT